MPGKENLFLVQCQLSSQIEKGAISPHAGSSPATHRSVSRLRCSTLCMAFRGCLGLSENRRKLLVLGRN